MQGVPCALCGGFLPLVEMTSIDEVLAPLLKRILEEAGIPQNDAVISALCVYLRELETWNRRMDLSGIQDMEGLALKFVGDTAPFAPLVPTGTRTVLDIGTGAGAPGLVLKILLPQLEVVLVDALRKRVSFLRHVIALLGLTGVTAHHGRVGEPGIPHIHPPEGFDLVTSQAVGSLDLLTRLAIPLLGPGGVVVAFKGPKAAAEVKVYREILAQRGFLAKTIPVRQPVSGLPRTLVFLRRNPSSLEHSPSLSSHGNREKTS